jgi:hypothetical protein
VRVIRDRCHDNGIACHFKLLCMTDSYSATVWDCAMTESGTAAVSYLRATDGA